MSRYWLWAFGLYGALSSACTPAAPERLIEPHAASVRLSKVPAPLAAAAAAPIACFADLLCLADIHLPKDAAQAGGRVSITYIWSVRREPGRSWKAFLHGSTSASAAHRFNDDHHPGSPSYPMARWAPGDLIKVTRSLSLPKNLPSARYELWGGFFQGDERLRVSSGMDDGRDRARFGVIRVDGKKVPKPRATVRRLKAELSIDGRLDEPDWARAERLGPFWKYDGEGRGRYQTYARLLWDDEALYIGFMVADSDIRSDYTERDDELWKSDVVEVYLDPDADGQQYIELQLSPNNVVFDALFRSHRAPPWEEARGWNMAGLQSATSRGTLPGRPATTGWFAEIRIPWADLSPANGAKPEIDSRWRANFFRVDQSAAGIRNVSWSPVSTDPNRADFHNLDRAGTLIFADTPAALRNRILQSQPPAANPAPQPTEAPAQPGVAPAQPTVAPAQPSAAPAQPTVAPAQPSAAPSGTGAAPSH